MVRKVLRNSTSGSALLLRDLMYDSNGNVKPTRLSALLNAALGYVADQTQGFIDFDAVPEDGASIQVSAQLFSIPKRLFWFRNAIPTLGICNQKRLGTVESRFYIVEMF